MKKIAMLAVFAAALLAIGCSGGKTAGGTTGGASNSTTGGKPDASKTSYVGTYKVDARDEIAKMEAEVADMKNKAEAGDATAKNTLPVMESSLAEAKKLAEALTVELRADKTWTMNVPGEGAVSGTFVDDNNRLTLTPTKFDTKDAKDVTEEQKKPQVIIYDPATESLKAESADSNSPAFIKVK